jgi:putative SOS response-associated peptidase YedK
VCGRFTHMYRWRELVRLMRLTVPSLPEDPKPSCNVAPTQPAPIVRRDGEAWNLGEARWGLMPPWATKPGPINARAETIATLPMFRSAFAKRRCIIPASGFYEWQKTGGKVKQPWYIYRADGEPLLLAGIYEVRDDGETFAIITCAANEFLRPMHDRMPVVLEPESVAQWLGAPDTALLRPAADGVLTAHTVGTRVNSPKNDDPGLVEPV